MTTCTFLSISHPTVRAVVRVLIDGGHVISITGTSNTRWKRGGHSNKSRACVNYSVLQLYNYDHWLTEHMSKSFKEGV